MAFMLILLALLTLLALFAWLLAGRSKNDRRVLLLEQSGVPNISRLPFIGGFLKLSSFKPDNLHLKFKEFVSRYGKSFYTKDLGVVVVVTAEQCYVDALLSSQQHVRKNILYNMLRTWLGNGLLLSYGAPWQSMRKIITPTFHFRILEQSFVEVFDRQSVVLVDKLRAHACSEHDGIVDIYPLIGLAALDIITETAMGVRVNAQLNAKSDIVHAVKDVTNILATRFVRPHLMFPLLFRLFWSQGYVKQLEGIQLMHKFTNSIIEQRRRLLLQQQAASKNQQPNGTDMEAVAQRPMALLDVLLQATIDDVPLSDKQIRDEVNTFIFEGHDTTTSATSFCLYLISRHARVQQTLFDEIRAHFGDNRTRAIRYADLQALSYLNCVVREALRLYPPIPAIGRWLQSDLTLDNGAALPAGANVIVMLWQLLRDPDVFDAPEEFRPERHMEQNTRANAFSNIPFSAGPRNCIGQRFALLEMKTIVINILRHYELLPLGAEVQPSIKIVLRSKTGVNLGIRMRTY